MFSFFQAMDCYTIGREAYLAKNWQMSRDWMKEALHKYDEGLSPAWESV